METSVKSVTTSVARPSGNLAPTHERAVRAIKALAESRLGDAESNIVALPDEPGEHRVWKHWLSGRLALAKENLFEAESSLLQAAALAWLDGASTANTTIGSATANADEFLHHHWELKPESGRLLGAVWEHLGCLYRRQERCEEARRAHRVAIQLRSAFGSLEEQWESAIGLGLTETIAGRPDESRKWYQAAFECAGRAAEAADEKTAETWQCLAASLMEQGEYVKAAQAARKAREAWRRCNAGTISAAQSELSLGRVLLRCAETPFASDSAEVPRILDEAVECLESAEESLAAFGANAADSARICTQLLDFAGRLREGHRVELTNSKRL
jgi:Flp pilus assembly protein TadD